MKRIPMNKDWGFYENNETTAFNFGSPEPVKVDLPHDYIITKPRSANAAGGAANGYFGEGEGVYTKVLDIPADWENKRILLDIDGAYMNTEIVMNQQVIALHPYGYTPYLADLTPALRFNGKPNNLKVITQSRQPSTRWYSGGGIYRSVSLWVGEGIYIKPWDVFITTPSISADNAVVNCGITVTADSKDVQNTELLVEVIDAGGNVVAAAEKSLEVSGGNAVCSVDADVKNPKLWDLDSPYLYTLKVTVKQGGKVLDIYEDTFGIRTISVDVENGFMLNGKTIKLKGGCLHHDNGLLGACAYEKAEERKIRLLQSVGYNAVRISHYPPSLEMLKVCDRLGMLLLDECFDVWRMGKQPLDYHLYFEDWWERDIELMVKRDRNHPCVITYSIGNEIGERDGSSDGAAWSKRLTEKFKSLDSTRPVLSALCGVFGEDTDMSNFEANSLAENDEWAVKTEGYCEPLDIVGYNYLYQRYKKDHERFPNRVMVGSETHSFTTYDYWQATMECPWVIGDFIWAAVDYLGEVGVGKVYWKKEGEEFKFMGDYPWRTSWQSDLLQTGKRRPQSYFREIMWGNTDNTYIFTTHPKHYGDEFAGSNWHWPDVNNDWSFGKDWLGKPVEVSCYSAGDEVEFILNGKSLGRTSCEKLVASMDINFEEGTLEAVSYKDGKEISRGRLVTAGKAAALHVIPEEAEFSADGSDLCYVNIELVDENGTILPTDNRRIKISAPGKIAALGSGNPCIDEPVNSDECRLYNGTALLILKTDEPGDIEITVSDESGISAKAVVMAK